MKKLNIGSLLLLMAFSSYSMDTPLYKKIHNKEENFLDWLPKEISQKIGPLLLTHTDIIPFITLRLMRHMKADTYDGLFGPNSVSSNEQLLVTTTGGILWDHLPVYSTQSTDLLKKIYCNDRDIMVDINRQGTRILGASYLGPFYVWDVQPFKLLHTVNTRVACFACFTPDGTQVITFGRTLKFWNYETGECVRSIDPDIFCVHGEFSQDGTLLLTTGKTGPAKIWNVESGECVHELIHESANELRSAHFNSDGHLIVTAAEEGTVNVWDVATGECLNSFEHDGAAISRAHFYGTRNIACITKDPPTSEYDYSSRNYTLWLWNLQDNTCSSILLKANSYVGFLNYKGSLALVDCSKKGSFDVISLERMHELLQFLHEHINAKQADILCRVYDRTFLRGIIKLKESKGESVITEEGTVLNRDDLKFNFNTCPHLQEVYESIEDEIKAIFDPHIIRVKE